MFSPMDITVGIIAQPNPSVAVTTGNLLMLDYIPGSLMMKETDQVESATIKPGRATAGSRRGKVKASGSIKFRLHDDAATELLFSSGLGNTWLEAGAVGDVGDTLTASSKKVSFMLVQIMQDEAGVFTKDTFLGCEVTKISFSAENSAGLEVTVEIIALDMVTSTGDTTLTKVASSTALEMLGDDVKNITINGVTITGYTKLDLTIEQPRDPNYVLGSSVATAVSASGTRKGSGGVSYFRQNGALPGFTGGAQAMSFSLGDAYDVAISAAYFSWPKDSYGGSAVETTANFTIGYDNVALTDIKITRKL
ncbi:phage tail tube protein [Sphingomonas aurantiaca]|uniref:phage tail tube protein n=1 Tax=Sphingomonas aurantiaca TaxID=185949 RepID=UPI002FE06878